MSRKTVIWTSVIATFALVCIAVSAAWVLSLPRTPEEQFAAGEKLETQVRGDLLVKSASELEPKIQKTIAEYEKVGKRFGAGPKAAAAEARIAKIQEEIRKDDASALARLEKITKEYPTEELGGTAMLEEARILRRQADTLKATDQAKANEVYRQTLTKLNEYRKAFAAAPKGGGALLEIGRIWQDGIGTPPIRAIEAFEQVLKDYARTEYEPEALFRLGQIMELIKEDQRAIGYYGDLIERYPKSEWADKALFNRGRILADKMDKPKEAADDFKKLQEEHPESPLSGQAKDRERGARQDDATKESEGYSKQRYGGGMPVDTLKDKPMPPSAMFKKFADQKLDAQKYDLNVTFAPKDQKITVEGTLSLINRGEEKKEMLLMLSRGMNISRVMVNGMTVKNELLGETWRLSLNTPLKKDEEANIAFTYDGVFSAPEPGKPMALEEKEKPGSSTPELVPSTAPASQPAGPKTRKGTFNPQLALGDYGFALSGGAWYPVTIIGDLFDAKMTFKAPAGLEVVSNGAMEKRSPETGEFVFDTKRPVFGLYFVYGKFNYREQTVNGVQYSTYLRDANKNKSEAYVKVAARILGFYSEKFAPFPYEKMSIVETPLPPFLGGVGPASMMMLHEGMVAQPDVPEALLAHELAHQWFGNLVPINMMDPGYNQWLSEGFATYCDALYTEKTQGHEAFVKHMKKYGQLYFHFAVLFPKNMGSIRDTIPGTPPYRPVVYEKGALVLHALRKVMGDEKFFDLMKRFVGTYRDKPSVVDDFRRMASDVAGQDLSWFFSEWLDQSVFARWEFMGVTGPNDGKLTLVLKQPEDLMKMPVDITLVGENGQRKVIKDQMIDQYEQKIQIDSTFKPIKIILDEDYWILKHPGRHNVWPAENETAATEK